MRSIKSAVIVAALTGAAFHRAAAQTTPAWSYTVNLTTDSANGHPPLSMAMKHQISDHMLRTEIVQISGASAAMAMVEGSYTIMNSADSTMTQVTPRYKMATVMGLGMLGQNRTVRVDTSQYKKTIEDLGPGERLMGHATHHFRVTSSGTMTVAFGDNSCTQPVDGVSELWIAPDVDLVPAMEATLKVFGATPGLDQIVRPARDLTSTLPRGTPLRSITRQTRINAQGVPRTITTTMEYLDIQHGPVNTAVFMVPPDFKKMDLRSMMANLPPGTLDSAMKQRSGGVAGTSFCGSM
jgi:hypothetical protein